MRDVKVANERIVIESSARQCVCAGWQDDGIGADGKVGLHDGGAQRAIVISRATDAVRRIGVGQVSRAIYGIGTCNDWENNCN